MSGYTVKLLIMDTFMGEKVEVARVMISRHTDYMESVYVKNNDHVQANRVCLQVRQHTLEHMTKLFTSPTAEFYFITES